MGVPLLRALVIASLLGLVARPFGGLPAVSPAAPAPVVADPADVVSTTHEPNVSSTNAVVAVAWSSLGDVLGYSFKWSELSDELPDTIADLSGTSIGTVSARLAPGSWYFHLRTQGESGAWTSTVHLGPFVVVSAEPPQPPPPNLSISGARADEGDDNSTELSFVLSLSKKSGKRVRVDYSTSNGTATAGRDYEESTGTVTFRPGQKKKALSIHITGDNRDEPNETVFVRLSEATNARIRDLRAKAVIVDDDVKPPPPSLTVHNDRVVEGTGSATRLEFTVSLSRAIRRRVHVDFSTVGGTADAPVDFHSRRGTVRFAPRQTERVVTVTIRGDEADEPAEVLFVDLSEAVNATIEDARGEGTIVDDDRRPRPPTISINDITFDEGTGGRRKVQFTLTLSRRADERVAVNFSTVDGSATAPNDYRSRNGRVAIRFGERRRLITVTVVGDDLEEGNEEFFVVLSNPSGARIADRRGWATIIDDDP